MTINTLPGQPRTWELPSFELPETTVIERPGEGFGKPLDAWFSRPVKVALAAIDGSIRAGVDLLVPERRAPAAAAVRTPLDRAREAQRALVDQHAMPGAPDRFYGDVLPITRTDAWPLGQVLHGRVLLAMQDGDWSRVEGTFRELESYRLGDGFTPHIAIPERYYDDNAWIGLAAMQAYTATGDERYLAHAERTFRQVRSGQGEDGGLYWLEQDRSTRNTCSVAPAAQLALQLHAATGSERYLEFAKEQAAWLNRHLRDERGLYLDHVRADGSVDTRVYSYNQGTPIGLDVQLYRATGEQRYLQRARQTADAALTYLGAEDRLWKDAPVFNAVFFRNLLALEAVAPDPRYLAAIDGYLERAWHEGRDEQTGLFDKGGIGHYGAEAGTTIDQGAMSQLYAARALPRERWADLT